MRTSLRSVGRYLWSSWIKPLAVSAVIVFPLKSAVVDWNWVPSGSMRPSILEGELVFVNKLAYDLKVPFTTQHVASWGNPSRGDVVVCFSPANGTRLVKRVIGLPGDRISVVGGQLTINGVASTYDVAEAAWSKHLSTAEQAQTPVRDELLGDVHHPILASSPFIPRSTDGVYIVPAGKYFMMGDNRDRSFDSRYFGAVAREQIVGRASAIVLSFDPEHVYLPRPDRFFHRLM